jgi:hypothetical protein
MQGIMQLVLSHQVQIILHHFASIEGRILSSFKGHTDALLDHKMQENFINYFPGMVYFCVRLASGRNAVFMIHTLFNETKHGFGEIFRLEFSTGMV